MSLEDEYNEWSGVDLPQEINPYLGMTIDELLAQQKQISLALNLIDPTKHQMKYNGVLHKLIQVNAALHQREN